MKKRIGLIREGKMPPDKRVPLSPNQCVQVMEEYPNIQIVVQKSEVRAFKDEEYRALGIEVVEQLDDCDIIFGVKEVNIEDLIPDTHFFFFSHTFKKQPYNRKLLQAIVKKRIKLTDYEVLTNWDGQRLVGFGKYAGIVGCYNAFLTYGKKHRKYTLKPAHQCEDQNEMEQEFSRIKLPGNTKIILTGNGRVARGALEVIEKLPIIEVSPEDFLTKEFNVPVYTHLKVENYIARDDGKPFDKYKYYQDAKGHQSTFSRYLKHADIFIAAHYWKTGSPYFYTQEDLKKPNIRISVVADISCDIGGPIASTIRASTVANPIYGYNPITGKEDDFMKEGTIAVMAVDNLPCELPKDASKYFGNVLIDNVLPLLFMADKESAIERGSQTTFEGKLSPYFEYLEDYLMQET